jgi:hypothetical protein
MTIWNPHILSVSYILLFHSFHIRFITRNAPLSKIYFTQYNFPLYNNKPMFLHQFSPHISLSKQNKNIFRIS